LRELVFVVRALQELADLHGVRHRGLVQLGAAGLGEDRVDDAAIARALLAGNEAVAFQAVEESSHAARGQQKAVCQVDAPQLRFRRLGEL
jgi:hypothetical protein